MKNTKLSYSNYFGANRILQSLSNKLQNEKIIVKHKNQKGKNAKINPEYVLGFRWAFEFGCVDMASISRILNEDINFINRYLNYEIRLNLQPKKEDKELWLKVKSGEIKRQINP